MYAYLGIPGTVCVAHTGADSMALPILTLGPFYS
jgi:hypothetical protein